MVLAIVASAVLVLSALSIATRFTLLERLYLPVSVIAGFLGFLTVQLVGMIQGDQQFVVALHESTGTIVDQWRDWPGFLIAVVFAGMLLDRKPSSSSNSVQRAAREGLMVWIIVLGQTTIGLLVTWLILMPLNHVPPEFGMLIETGWAGGHGTAAAMGEVFSSPAIAFPSGLDLGMVMATVGLVYGVLSGVIWVNIGTRCGWTSSKSSHALGRQAKLVSKEKTIHANRATVDSKAKRDEISVVLFHVVMLSLAVGVGILLQNIVAAASVFVEQSWLGEVEIDPNQSQKGGITTITASFPLFIYTLFGGWIVRRVARAVSADDLIDSTMVSELSTVAMDFLVIAAIASLNVTAVSAFGIEMVALFIAAAIWTGFCLGFLSRHVLPSSHWFELGLINYGMSTGTTATGFVLLRLVDPKLESGAAEDYALAAPISSPFIGGGMLTIAIPLIVLPAFPLGMVCSMLLFAVVSLIVCCFVLRRKTWAS